MKLCEFTALNEGESRGFQLTLPNGENLNLLAVKKAGEFYVYRNLCPHVLIPLEWVAHQFLTDDASLIQCANHGALFRIEDGQCVAGPCAGQSLQAIATYQQNGSVFLYRHAVVDTASSSV